MSVLTSQPIAALALELLRRALVLPATVARVGRDDYTGSGGTVTVRVRQGRTVQEQNTPGQQINFNDLEEVPVDVAVGQLYDATSLSDHDLALNLTDFGSQVLQPLVATVAEGAEAKVASAFGDVTEHPSIVFDETASDDNTRAVVLAIREAMTKAKVPLGNRYLAVSPEIATRILELPEITEADKAGTPSALRDAIVTRYRGFTIVETPTLTDEAVAYHKSGVVFAAFAPAEAVSTDSTSMTDGGVGLRTVRQFDINTLSELVAVSTFAGAAPVQETDESSPDESDFPRIMRIGVEEESS